MAASRVAVDEEGDESRTPPKTIDAALE